jgi:hypothetical protein
MTNEELQNSFKVELKEKFVARLSSDEGTYLLLHPDDSNEKWMVILSNYTFWGQPENDLALKEWCNDHECVIEGMTISLPDEEAAMMFKLRWS